MSDIPSCSSGNNTNIDDSSNFECNICLDLAQDPILTLCGHLFCWPCLYKWLHLHSNSKECPVCKAVIQEDRLVPLYGRGKSSTDPRSKSIAGIQVPNRPSGQRPETAHPPGLNHGFGGFMGGFAAPTGVRGLGMLLCLQRLAVYFLRYSTFISMDSLMQPCMELLLLLVASVTDSQTLSMEDTRICIVINGTRGHKDNKSIT